MGINFTHLYQWKWIGGNNTQNICLGIIFGWEWFYKTWHSHRNANLNPEINVPLAILSTKDNYPFIHQNKKIINIHSYIRAEFGFSKIRTALWRDWGKNVELQPLIRKSIDDNLRVLQTTMKLLKFYSIDLPINGYDLWLHTFSSKVYPLTLEVLNLLQKIIISNYNRKLHLNIKTYLNYWRVIKQNTLFPMF